MEDGTPLPISEIAGLEVLDREEDRHYQEEAQNIAEFPVAPLRDDQRDHSSQHSKILDHLQRRYLPYLIGQRMPAIEHRISAAGGQYRVRIRYGNSDGWTARDYLIEFPALRFEEQPVAGDASEEYWANDLDDYFEGLADDFSTFCRTFPGGNNHHFWDCLGMPFLNDDLVARKIRHHFTLARDGHSSAEFVLPLWNFARQT